MEQQPVNGTPPNVNGNSKRPPSYSVETPYGFHLDLDFLKYVDDIEKGNTLKRVPVQRRTRPSSASALAHHNHSLPGHGRAHGPTQWSSIGSLWPKSRAVDIQHAYDGILAGYPRHAGSPYTPLTGAPMEESIRAFDEQPLGCYVRPNLLRASSLPATVLQRKRSESNDDPTSPRGSRDHLLLQEDGSSEDVFSDLGRASTGTGTLQRLTVALRRVGELEEEIRVIPELKAQICLLQEEKERLLMRLCSDSGSSLEANNSSPVANGRPRVSAGGSTDWSNGHSSGRGSSSLEDPEEDWMSRELKRLEEKVKASSVQVETEAMMSSVRDGTFSRSGQQPRSVLSKDRAEMQSVEALQKRLSSLEQRLRESEKELQTTKTVLQTQVEEGKLKDQRIAELSTKADIWVKMDRTDVNQNATTNLNTINTPSAVNQQDMPSQKNTSEITPGEGRVAGEGAGSGCRQEGRVPVEVNHHVKKVRQLLQKQWECLCGGRTPAEPLPPRVSSIQEELMRLVDTLASYMAPGQASNTGGQLTQAETSALRGRDVLVEETISGASHSRSSGQEKVAKEDTSHRDAAGTQKKTEREHKLQTQPGSQTTEPAVQQQRAKGNCEGQQGESKETEEPREATKRVDEAFITACLYLKDHMDEMANLNADMRQALTVVFQHWFQVTAEEDSSVHTVALYLEKIRATAPSLLHFLVNLADDNGNTALHYSVSHSNFSIVQTLLNTGVCDVDVRNKAGYTPIMLASLSAADSTQDLEVVRDLVRRGDVNVRAGQAEQTALHLAARHGRRLIVPLLLAAGADTNTQDRGGRTALMLTCERGHGDIASLLLEQADCNLTLNDREGRSALSIALQASFSDIADLLKARMVS